MVTRIFQCSAFISSNFARYYWTTTWVASYVYVHSKLHCGNGNYGNKNTDASSEQVVLFLLSSESHSTFQDSTWLSILYFFLPFTTSFFFYDQKLSQQFSRFSRTFGKPVWFTSLSWAVTGPYFRTFCTRIPATTPMVVGRLAAHTPSLFRVFSSMFAATTSGGAHWQAKATLYKPCQSLQRKHLKF